MSKDIITTMENRLMLNGFASRVISSSMAKRLILKSVHQLLDDTMGNSYCVNSTISCHCLAISLVIVYFRLSIL
jgi:hypothetical protein